MWLTMDGVIGALNTNSSRTEERMPATAGDVDIKSSGASGAGAGAPLPPPGAGGGAALPDIK